MVRAYRTYFKLIRFDVTVFKADLGLVEQFGVEVDGDGFWGDNFPGLKRYFDDPVNKVGFWLKCWGIIFIVFGLALVSSFKYPYFLMGLFFALTGVLSFIFINKYLCMFYGLVTVSMGVFGFM